MPDFITYKCQVLGIAFGISTWHFQTRRSTTQYLEHFEYILKWLYSQLTACRHFKLQFSQSSFWANLGPQIENMRALLWRHKGEHDFPQLLIAHYLIYVGYSSDSLCLPSHGLPLGSTVFTLNSYSEFHYHPLGVGAHCFHFHHGCGLLQKGHQEPPDCHHCLCLKTLAPSPQQPRAGYPMIRPLI